MSGFLPSNNYVSTTEWMHHMDAIKKDREKTRWELHKKATSNFEQILKATPHETTAERPLTTHFKTTQVRRTKQN